NKNAIVRMTHPCDVGARPCHAKRIGVQAEWELTTLGALIVDPAFFEPRFLQLLFTKKDIKIAVAITQSSCSLESGRRMPRLEFRSKLGTAKDARNVGRKRFAIQFPSAYLPRQNGHRSQYGGRCR